MNVYNTMPGVAEMGMVWMGAGQTGNEMPINIMPGDNSDMLLDQENIYFTPSHHSMSNQSLEDMQSVHGSTNIDGMENYDMMHFIDMRHESNDSSYAEDENSQPVYMITTSTQTLPCTTRKIKPIKHPGLVLKTPIAYQSNTDPSVIPIQKDGIAVCEKCGAIGVKHAFYTRERRFCSMACARGFSGLIEVPLPQQNQSTTTTQTDTKPQYAKYRFTMKVEDDFTNTYIDEELPQLPPAPEVPPIDDSVPLIRRKPSELANSYDWDPELDGEHFRAAPVTLFKHAPMVEIWNDIMVGMKVEVENTDCDNVSESFADSFWVATVMKIVGYKAKLRYEGFASNDAKDFWVSLCSNQIHAVGWCATRGKPLIPPKTIQDKYSDWKDFLCKRLTGARTLPSNFSTKAADSLKSRFQVGLKLEVVDKNRIGSVKVAVIQKIVGRRLNVKYYDMSEHDTGFWCHEDSPLLHPVGWAKRIRHYIMAPKDYLDRINAELFEDGDATDELFTPFQAGTIDVPSGFKVGMKLEAIDPLNLSSICVATVMDVLNYGYIMISIDTYESEASGADWFCYHVKSPCIFPVGFCSKHDIPLTPPKGYTQHTFTWQKYLAITNKKPADASLFNSSIPQHGFEVGMKIEAADLMDPRLVCVATIARVVGRILKVHFDGWEEEYDQWLDCETTDIYPVGWCQSVGYKLEGPPNIRPLKSAKQQISPTVKAHKGYRKKGRKKRTVKETQSKMHSPPLKIIKTEDDEFIEESDEKTGPEAGQEPAGPDQTLPTPSEVQTEPPSERKVTSYINVTSSASSKLIPRLLDSSGGSCEMNGALLCPEEWNVFDVAQFLRVNDCANYCDAFSRQKIDGKLLMKLNKEDILEYTGGKVGPSLVIYDLIQQLKVKLNPSQLRHKQKSNIKKSL